MCKPHAQGRSFREGARKRTFEQLLTKGNLSAAYMITNKVKQKQLDGKE